MFIGRRRRNFKRITPSGRSAFLLGISSYRFRLLRLQLFKFFSSFLAGGAILSVVLLFILFAWYSRDLPSPGEVKRKEGFSTVILDRNEKTIYDIYTDKNRIAISLAQVPDYLKKATIAIEDKDFYKHKGFDQRGILRSIFRIITFRGLSGGSTLTQQLVKNVLLTSEKTIARKIKEFILAVQIERKYTKDEILQMYLNESPYGGTMWGIESASEGYFKKHAKDLDLTESVILAGLPQLPSFYSPFNTEHPDAYKKRAEEVLRRMREDGYITPEEEFETKKKLGEVKFASPSSQFNAPHFVFYVKKQLVERFGERMVEAGGLRVTTTLDLSLQEKTEAIIEEELEKLKGLNVSNGAALVLDPSTGEILAYVGSRAYEGESEELQGKFDVVSMGYRQPGSALKPITYATAFAAGYTPSSLIMDVETHFPGKTEEKDYIPKNYDNKFRGPVQLRFALGNSINVPAVKVTALVGVKNILKTAYDLGIGTLEPTDENIRKLGLSLTLGGGEVRLFDLTSSFSVFATGGVKNEPYSILKVVESTGKTLYEHKGTKGRKVLGEDVCFLISDILSDNNARQEVFGARSYLVVPGKTVAVKTGTTDDSRDNWAVGFAPSVVVGVWVGNNDNSPMNQRLVSGTTGAAPIWNRIIQEALKGKKDEPFRRPNNIVELTIDGFGGGLPHEGRPERGEFFIKGTEPKDVSPIYKKIKLSKEDNNKLANLIEIATGAYDEKEFVIFTEDDPTSRDEQNRWQEGIDKWLEEQSDPLYHPPRQTSAKDEDKVIVRIKKPEDKKQIDSNDVEIEADGQSTKDVKKMELYINNSLKETFKDDSFSKTVHLDTGVYKIKIKAYDEKDRSGESEVTIGVKTSPEPTSTPVPTPTSSSPTESPTATPTPS